MEASRRTTMNMLASSLRSLSIAAVGGLLVQAPREDEGHKVTVVARHFRNDQGKAGMALFANEDGFPGDTGLALRRAWVEIRGGEARFEFDHLRPGYYAVAVFHYENGNGRMDKNWLGVPQEGWGVSNDVRGYLGPPDFAKAAFRIPSHHLQVDVAIAY
jgi:uncharacterized protein (DUF2141 family)